MTINSGFIDGAYGELITKDKIIANYSFLIPATVAGGNLLFSWGRNNNGQLGLGDNVNRSNPVQVGSLLTWNNVACGGSYTGDQNHTVATKTDGSLWSWGYNIYGQLASLDRANRSSPVQVGSLLTWNNVACGGYHTVATKTDGSLWSWGLNNQGQLGLGNITHRSSPVQVGSLLTWNKIAGGYHTVATKTDGSLWTWGYNIYGQLGLGDVTMRSSPVQVGSLLTWNKIAAGQYHTVAIITIPTTWYLI